MKYLVLLWMVSCATSQKEDLSFSKEEEQITVGNQFAKKALWNEAAAVYKEVLKSNSKNPAARRNLGIVSVKLSEFKTAVTEFKKVEHNYRDDGEFQFFYGEALRGSDQYADAVFRYRLSQTLKPDDKRVQKALAWTLYKSRSYKDALRAISAYTKKNPKDEQAVVIEARTLIKLRREKEALTVLENKNIKSEFLPFIKSVAGDAYLSLGDKKKAEEAYLAALKDQPLLGGALLGYAKILFERKQFEGAKTYAERAVRIMPNLTEGYYVLAQMHEKTDRKKAAQFYGQFLKHATSDPEYLSLLHEVKNKVAQLK